MIALAAPPRVTVAPPPFVIVPEMVAAEVVTARLTVAALLKLADVPTIVIVNIPVAAALLGDSVRVLVVVVLVGMKDAVTPFGRPEADKLTLPVNPFSGITVIVLEPFDPCRMFMLLGDADSLKLGIDGGQLFTRLVALTVPIPVAKSQPVVVPYAGLYELLEVESTPGELESKKQLALPVQGTSMSPWVTS